MIDKGKEAEAERQLVERFVKIGLYEREEVEREKSKIVSAIPKSVRHLYSESDTIAAAQYMTDYYNTHGEVSNDLSVQSSHNSDSREVKTKRPSRFKFESYPVPKDFPDDIVIPRVSGEDMVKAMNAVIKSVWENGIKDVNHDLSEMFCKRGIYEEAAQIKEANRILNSIPPSIRCEYSDDDKEAVLQFISIYYEKNLGSSLPEHNIKETLTTLFIRQGIYSSDDMEEEIDKIVDSIPSSVRHLYSENREEAALQFSPMYYGKPVDISSGRNTQNQSDIDESVTEATIYEQLATISGNFETIKYKYIAIGFLRNVGEKTYNSLEKYYNDFCKHDFAAYNTEDSVYCKSAYMHTGYITKNLCTVEKGVLVDVPEDITNLEISDNVECIKLSPKVYAKMSKVHKLTLPVTIEKIDSESINKLPSLIELAVPDLDDVVKQLSIKDIVNISIYSSQSIRERNLFKRITKYIKVPKVRVTRDGKNESDEMRLMGCRYVLHELAKETIHGDNTKEWLVRRFKESGVQINDEKGLRDCITNLSAKQYLYSVTESKPVELIFEGGKDAHIEKVEISGKNSIFKYLDYCKIDEKHHKRIRDTIKNMDLIVDKKSIKRAPKYVVIIHDGRRIELDFNKPTIPDSLKGKTISGNGISLSFKDNSFSMKLSEYFNSTYHKMENPVYADTTGNLETVLTEPVYDMYGGGEKTKNFKLKCNIKCWY